jgi:threonine synthase
LTRDYPIAMLNSLNPYRLEGQKTGALKSATFSVSRRFHFVPVGNAGNITAYWKGYREYFEMGRVESLPKMCGFQAAGAAPLVLGHNVDHPDTIATAIRIGHPARGVEALAARDESGGFIGSVTDEEILVAQKTTAAF